ncbi:phenoloxidase 2-like [Trichogramma pretiosum]|uniref:phenoloxidase 2-like n=1 Tax=Trichogramma pretiosum TaxID=7493 RepID=UPI0006C9BA29|nr:phenoloxidase 2-like [Trichogramma pretiosum]
MSAIRKSDLLSLLYRIREPVYYPKNDLDKTLFIELSPEYLPRKYQTKAPQILSRFGEQDGRRIDISSMLRDDLLNIKLDEVQTVDRRDQFSLFVPKHHRAANKLLEIFLGLKSVDDLMAFAAYARERVNPALFAYAYSAALLHRPDTKNLVLPPVSEIFPHNFVDAQTIAEAKESADILASPSDRVAIEIPQDLTGNDRDMEHRLAYFREDLGINLHHWHWHLVYPLDGPAAVVTKDRRGELFYYMHHQVLARYNVERMCNGLDMVKRLEWDEAIEEAYFPMLNSDVSGRDWPSRPANLRLTDINRPDLQLSFSIDDLKRYEERIYEAIHKKVALDGNGQNIDLLNEQGIDVLGNMVEASILTPNADYYGNLHNMGHSAIAYIHDPKYQYIQSAAVMSETMTAMRDPVFYRWHKVIDQLFVEHKHTLTPYTAEELTFGGIQVTGLEVCSYNDQQVCRQDRNVLQTYFMRSDIDMSRGLDFTPRGPILVRVTHLSHDEYAFTIRVNNTTGRRVIGTVRIFIAPVVNNKRLPTTLAEQKTLMIELDRFAAELSPGASTIVRRSIDSGVTIPFKQIFRDLNANRPDDDSYREFDSFNYCGCGWPHHMLLPKGSRGGFDMELFVMISDYSQDKVQGNGEPALGECKTGMIICGLKDKFYPDRNPMGYPFDRAIRTGVNTLQNFMTPNMFSVPVRIMHDDQVRLGQVLADQSVSIKDLNQDLVNAAPPTTSFGVNRATTTANNRGSA